MVRVGAQVTGQIKAVDVSVGQTVRRSDGQTVRPGDLLVEIDAIPQQNALRIAQARSTPIIVFIICRPLRFVAYPTTSWHTAIPSGERGNHPIFNVQGPSSSAPCSASRQKSALARSSLK